MHYLPHNAQMTQNLAILWRSLPAPNIQQEVPTDARGELWCKKYCLIADLDDLVWSEEPVPDSQEYLYIHKIPRAATSTPTQSSGHASNPTAQPNQVDMPATPPLQPNQVDMLITPSPQPGQVDELMELDIPEDIPDLIDVPEEVLSDFEAWTHSMLDYPW